MEATVEPCTAGACLQPSSSSAAALLVGVASPAGAATTVPPTIAACPQFPSTNVWNKRVDSLPVKSNSAPMVEGDRPRRLPPPRLLERRRLRHPVSTSSTPRRRARRSSSSTTGESDHVGYPIPAKPQIEGGSDRHILMVDSDACRLYELFAATKTSTRLAGRLGCDVGPALERPAARLAGRAPTRPGCRSIPGLVRYPRSLAASSSMPSASRRQTTCNGYIYPARHEAGDGSCARQPADGPPRPAQGRGRHQRLRAAVAQVLLTALKRYGMILADNGSPLVRHGRARQRLGRRRPP